jgi:hypothetical protein
MMEKMLKFLIVAACFLLEIPANGQDAGNDSLQPFRELARLNDFYHHLPVALVIHIGNTAVPVTAEKDTLQTDIRLYYDPHHFYMQAEGLAEIVDDSLVVMLNQKTKQVVVYPGGRQQVSALFKTGLAFMPDSSLAFLSAKYTAESRKIDRGKNRIELVSRKKLSGTDLPKETITIEYEPSTHEPILLQQKRVLFAPIDSITYVQWQIDPSYKGKLIHTVAGGRRIYFLIREFTTSYRFVEIDFSVKAPPVLVNDVVRKQTDGQFTLTGKYQDYTLSNEF